MKTNWQTKKLGEVCVIYQPKTISAKEMVLDGKYVVFGANGIIGRYDKYNHDESQLLITCRGATCGSVNISQPKSWITGNAMVVRPKNTSLDLKYLEYIFRGGLDISKVITGAAQPQITRANLEPVKISYPESLPEQHRIVKILDEVFKKTEKVKENSEKNLQNAKDIFESYLQSVFNNSGKNWIICTVEDLFKDGIIEKIQDGNHGELHPRKSDFVDKGVPFIMASDLNNKQVDLENCNFITEKQAKKLRIGFAKNNDVLLTHKGTIGRTAILKTDMKYVILTPQVTYYRIKNNSKLVNKYLMYYFDHLTFQTELKNLAKDGSTRAYIGITKQLKLSFAYPPLLSQKSIVAKLDALSTETKKLEAIYKQKLADLEELKKSVLKKAFSGEL